MESLKLIIPSEEYLPSYVEMLNELSAEELDIAEPHRELLATKGFSSYSQKLADDTAGKNLPEGWVPATLYWAIAENQVVGRLQLRHSLPRTGGHIGYAVRPSERRKGYGTQILKLGLAEAKCFGIAKAYITCDKTNVGSQGVIKANGGILADEFVDGSMIEKLGFWIHI